MNNIITKEEKNMIKEGCKNVESYLGYHIAKRTIESFRWVRDTEVYDKFVDLNEGECKQIRAIFKEIKNAVNLLLKADKIYSLCENQKKQDVVLEYLNCIDKINQELDLFRNILEQQFFSLNDEYDIYLQTKMKKDYVIGYYSDENEIKIGATKMIGSNERTVSYFVNSILLKLVHIRNILESKISNTIGNTQNNLETSKISKR